MAWHGRPWRRAAASQPRRRAASRPRLSITVKRRRRSRRSRTSSRTAKASVPARWSWSPSPTRARSASVDTTWLGRNWAAAHVDLPAPEGPTSTTTQLDGSRTAAPTGEGEPATGRECRRSVPLDPRRRRWLLPRLVAPIADAVAYGHEPSAPSGHPHVHVGGGGWREPPGRRGGGRLAGQPGRVLHPRRHPPGPSRRHRRRPWPLRARQGVVVAGPPARPAHPGRLRLLRGPRRVRRL